jgi:hypothetical protein
MRRGGVGLICFDAWPRWGQKGKTMRYEDRLARLDAAIAEGRLIRHKWQDLGKNTACLLATLSPEVGAQETVAACPSEVMPQWLAHLTPWIDDAGSSVMWSSVVSRYAAIAHKWGDWSAEAWERKHYLIRAAFVREAMRHTKDARTLEVCETSAALCERQGQGGIVVRKDWRAAESAAKAAAWAAESAAESAAKAAAWAAAKAAAESAASARVESAAKAAAESAAEAAAESAAKAAAESAAESAAWAAAKAAAKAAAWAAEWAAKAAAESAAVDRMIEAALTILEAPNAV